MWPKLCKCRSGLTFESKISDSRSTIDYFLVSENLSELITNYAVKHSCDNLSDHSILQFSHFTYE
jgi:exonuclease III